MARPSLFYYLSNDYVPCDICGSDVSNPRHSQIKCQCCGAPLLSLLNEKLKLRTITRSYYYDMLKYREVLSEKHRPDREECEAKRIFDQECHIANIKYQETLANIKRPINTKKEFGAKLAKWKQTIHERDNYTCVECGSKFMLQAHHIKSKSKYPELILDIDNGITLCIICHADKHPDVGPLVEKSKYYAQYQ